MNRVDHATGTRPCFPRRRAMPPSRAEIEQGIARGRRLQGEAVQATFRGLLHLLAGGRSLRGLRGSGSVPGRRHSCC